MFNNQNKSVSKLFLIFFVIVRSATISYAQLNADTKKESDTLKSHTSLTRQTSLANQNIIRFEHIGINVTDPIAAAKWYSENLGMIIIRKGSAPNFSTFVADSSIHMMIEFTYNKDYPTIEQLNLNYDSFHLAFCVNDILTIKERLINAGASVLDDLHKTSSGDQILVLRDPWGLSIQFVKRVNPMIDKKGIFIEHIAFNVSDSPAKSKWFVDNLNMIIMREGKAPSYGMFIADQIKSVMFEFYQHTDSPVIDFNKISHMTLHVAFSVSDINSLKEILLSNAAILVDDVYKTSSGDSVMNLRDAFGLPLQFVNRVSPMLK